MAPAAAVARGAACGERDGAPQALVGRRLDKGEHCLGLVERVQFKRSCRGGNDGGGGGGGGHDGDEQPTLSYFWLDRMGGRPCRTRSGPARSLPKGRRPSERLRTKVNWAGRMAEGGGAADAAESMPVVLSCPPGHCEPLAQLCCVHIVGACAEGKRRTAVGSMRPVCGGARAARPRGRSAAARAGPARMHRAQFAGGVRRRPVEPALPVALCRRVW